MKITQFFCNNYVFLLQTKIDYFFSKYNIFGLFTRLFLNYSVSIIMNAEILLIHSS